MGMQSRSQAVAVVARQSYWRVEDARVVIDAWRRSRQSQRAFGERYGLDPKRIGRWASRLASEVEDDVVRFHPVRVIPSRAPGVEEGDAIEIALGDGRTVRVPPGFAAADLARVVAVLTAGAED